MKVLQQNVLLLNKYYMAVQVTIVPEAIKAIVKGHGVVVDEDYINYNLEQWVEFTDAFKVDEETSKKYAGLVRSPSIAIFAPQVVRFPDCEYTSPLIKTVKYSRKNIYNRDKNTCQYCNNRREEFRRAMKSGRTKKSLLNLDHVIPRAKGGKSSWTNMVTSCTWCNNEKGDKLLSELGWKLIKQPQKPKWQSHVATPFEAAMKEYWQRFLAQ